MRGLVGSSLVALKEEGAIKIKISDKASVRVLRVTVDLGSIKFAGRVDRPDTKGNRGMGKEVFKH